MISTDGWVSLTWSAVSPMVAVVSGSVSIRAVVGWKSGRREQRKSNATGENWWGVGKDRLEGGGTADTMSMADIDINRSSREAREKLSGTKMSRR